MIKFHRNYKATFEIYDVTDVTEKKLEKVVTIENPITCHIHIDMDVAGQASLALFQFINLDKDTRAYLWKDLYPRTAKEIKYIKMSFEAGYGYPDDKTGKFVQTLIYKGIVNSCYSQKAEGSTEWVTQVQAAPADIYEYAFVNSTLMKGTSIEYVINHLLESAENTSIGYLTSEIPPLARNKTFVGQIMDLLNREYGGYEIFVDRGLFNILGENDVIPGEIMVITDGSGLLGSPRRAAQFVEVDMLFEPQLKIGQAVTIDSKLMPQYNQLYKVIAISHQGVISERECGKLITKVTLWAIIDKKDVKELKPAKIKTYEKKADTAWQKPVMGRISSIFGWRTDPITKQRKYHDGIDIAANKDTPIYAPANGIVSFVGWKGGYGKAVQLNNGKSGSISLSSLFGHLNSTSVVNGQQVFKGQTILGYVGSTGRSTGPHLHFEVRENGQLVDPQKYVGKY